MPLPEVPNKGKWMKTGGRGLGCKPEYMKKTDRQLTGCKRYCLFENRNRREWSTQKAPACSVHILTEDGYQHVLKTWPCLI